MKKTSDAKIRANNRYKNKTYEVLQVFVNRKERMNELVKLAHEAQGKSKAQYVVDALKAQLKEDGFTVEDLPPLGG